MSAAAAPRLGISAYRKHTNLRLIPVKRQRTNLLLGTAAAAWGGCLWRTLSGSRPGARSNRAYFVHTIGVNVINFTCGTAVEAELLHLFPLAPPAFVARSRFWSSEVLSSRSVSLGDVVF